MNPLWGMERNLESGPLTGNHGFSDPLLFAQLRNGLQLQQNPTASLSAALLGQPSTLFPAAATATVPASWSDHTVRIIQELQQRERARGMLIAALLQQQSPAVLAAAELEAAHQQQQHILASGGFAGLNYNNPNSSGLILSLVDSQIPTSYGAALTTDPRPQSQTILPAETGVIFLNQSAGPIVVCPTSQLFIQDPALHAEPRVDVAPTASSISSQTRGDTTPPAAARAISACPEILDQANALRSLPKATSRSNAKLSVLPQKQASVEKKNSSRTALDKHRRRTMDKDPRRLNSIKPAPAPSVDAGSEKNRGHHDRSCPSNHGRCETQKKPSRLFQKNDRKLPMLEKRRNSNTSGSVASKERRTHLGAASMPTGPLLENSHSRGDILSDYDSTSSEEEDIDHVAGGDDDNEYLGRQQKRLINVKVSKLFEGSTTSYKNSSLPMRQKPKTSEKKHSTVAPMSSLELAPPLNDNTRTPKRKKRKYSHESFVQKLHRVVTDLESTGRSDVVSFLEEGGLWVHKPDVFVKQIMPQYYRGNTWACFRRQLFSYGFPMEKSGENKGAYLNTSFLRGHPELCAFIERDDRYDKKTTKTELKSPRT
ncbi:hypothetical protein ACA910_022550 [Epithemia clementina (nom. ined.)]